MEIIIEDARHSEKILAIRTKEFSGRMDPGNFIFLIERSLRILDFATITVTMAQCRTILHLGLRPGSPAPIREAALSQTLA
jgi:hypothetical protein